MRVTRKKIRQIIKEALLQEWVEGAPEWPGDDEFIEELAPFIATAAWDGAAQLMYHYGFEYPDIGFELNDSEWVWQLQQRHESSFPDGVDWRQKIENAAYDIDSKRMKEAIKADPDKKWFKALETVWGDIIEPADMESLGWKEYKRYVRLKPPRSISHGVGEAHFMWDDIEQYGTREEFLEFLENRAGQKLQRRVIPKPLIPKYD